MTKADLVQEISKQTGIDRNEVFILCIKRNRAFNR